MLRILVVNKNHYKGKLYEQNWQGNDMKLRGKISSTRSCMDRNSKYIVRIIYCSVNLRDVILIKVTVKKRYVNSP